jgi:hypothetical protein
MRLKIAPSQLLIDLAAGPISGINDRKGKIERQRGAVETNGFFFVLIPS